MALEVGHYVRFKSEPACSGTIFEVWQRAPHRASPTRVPLATHELTHTRLALAQFQDEGMVAGLTNLSQKLIASGVDKETHEPVENLEKVCDFKVGQKVYFKSDGPAFCGIIFEFQDDGMVAGLKDLSDKLKGLGCGDETHEPVENLAACE